MVVQQKTSEFVDHCLQPMARSLSSHIRDSTVIVGSPIARNPEVSHLGFFLQAKELALHGLSDCSVCNFMEIVQWCSILLKKLISSILSSSRDDWIRPKTFFNRHLGVHTGPCLPFSVALCAVLHDSPVQFTDLTRVQCHRTPPAP